MDPAVTTFVILGVAVLAFATGRIPPALVAIGVVISVWASGVLDLPQALAGFSDPTVVLIAALFVVSEALDATGFTAWIGALVIERTGSRRGLVTLVTALIAAVLAAFISINGAVGALLPVVLVVAARAGIVPSKLLLPLAFAASAGSLLTLTGTPVNLLVSEAAVAAGGRAFGFFEFALVGLPLVVCTAVIVALGGRALPSREPAQLGADGAQTIRDLRDSYGVSDETDLIGAAEGVAEVLIAPRSPLVGREVCAGMRTRREQLLILAIRRGARDELAPAIEGTGMTRLRVGDSVLVQGPWPALERYVASPEVIPVIAPQALRRSVPWGSGARRAVGVLVVMVVLFALGVIPPVVVGLAGAGALIVLRVVTVPEAFRAIPWTTLLLIAGMIPLSTAIVRSGAAALIADGVLAVVGSSSSPHLALLVLAILTVALGQFISNVATVLVMAPIAVVVAEALGASVQPFMMALTVAGAASFLTPIATPVNLMVMQPAGYRFGDYWRLGAPLAAVFVLFAVFYVPLVWPFST